WIEECSGSSQRLFNEAAHLPTGETGFARSGIDRHHPANSRGVTFLARGADDDVHDGIGHLTLTLVVTHFAKEERLNAEGELSFTPGLIEKNHLERIAVVAHGHVDHYSTLSSATTTNFFHFAVYRGLVAYVEIGEIEVLGSIQE